MVLREIAAAGLKGQKFKIQLGEGNIIVGPNDAGKTAVLDAIRFLCRGKFPEVKKGDWPEAIVSGRFDEGAITRSINSKGTVSTTGNLEMDLDIPLLDPEQYFGLSDKERTNYVFERVQLPDTDTAPSIVAAIERLSFGEEHTEAIQKAKEDVIVELRDCFNQPSVQEALAQGVEKMRARFTYWNRRAKETQGAVTTLTELKLRGEASAAPANLEAEIAAAENLVAMINREHGALKQKRDAAEQIIATRRQLQKQLDEDRTDYATLLGNAREKRNALAADFERANDSIIAIDIKELRAELTEAENELRKAHDRQAAAAQQRDDATKLLKALEDQTECPYCHSKHTAWKASVQSNLESQMADASTSYEAQSGMVSGGLIRVSDLRARIQSFEQIRQKTEAQKLELKRLGDDIDRILADQEREKKSRASWKERLETLGKPGDLKTMGEELIQVERRRSLAEGTLSNLKQVKAIETRLQQDLLRADQAAQEHHLAAAQLAVTKKVGKLLDERREAMVNGVVATLLATAEFLAKGILKSPLIIHDGVIGRMAGAEFVSHHWFGGTAKAITYIAIATALSMSSPFRLVLLDEFGRLDESNQSKVIKRLMAMLENNMIDQFVVVGTQLHDSGEKWPGLKRIKVGP
jgi:energy-coupling factor transporter ATP-binding protein EcfA2